MIEKFCKISPEVIHEYKTSDRTYTGEEVAEILSFISNNETVIIDDDEYTVQAITRSSNNYDFKSKSVDDLLKSIREKSPGHYEGRNNPRKNETWLLKDHGRHFTYIAFILDITDKTYTVRYTYPHVAGTYEAQVRRTNLRPFNNEGRWEFLTRIIK